MQHLGLMLHHLAFEQGLLFRPCHLLGVETPTSILSASPGAEDSPIPLCMALGRSLKRKVPPDTVLAYGMVGPLAGSALWRLREQQDNFFLKPSLRWCKVSVV